MWTIFTGQRNNDWAKLNRDLNSDKLPQTVINGSILWLWESGQFVHEWKKKNDAQVNLRASFMKYRQTQQELIIVLAQFRSLFILER